MKIIDLNEEQAEDMYELEENYQDDATEENDVDDAQE